MTENRCPKCDLLNLPSAIACLQCNTPLSTHSMSSGELKTEEFPNTKNNIDPPKTAEYSGSTTNYSQPIAFDSQILRENKTGARTYFWYRMLCSVIVVGGIFWAVLGFLAILGSYSSDTENPANAFKGGVFMLLSGGIPAFLFLLGVIFPPRSWSWIFGIFLLVLALLSCGFAPFAIALIIFWMKPETQTYFGRN